jgi:hypothetical protein
VGSEVRKGEREKERGGIFGEEFERKMAGMEEGKW